MRLPRTLSGPGIATATVAGGTLGRPLRCSWDFPSTRSSGRLDSERCTNRRPECFEDFVVTAGRRSPTRGVAAVGRGVDYRPPEAFSPFGETRSGQAFRGGEPIIENDYSQQPSRGRAMAAYGSQSAARLPVKAWSSGAGPDEESVINASVLAA